MTARIEPGGRDELGLVGWTVARASGLVTGTEPPNLFRVLGRHRKLFRGWLRFAGRLMPGGTLPRREKELVILRVAHLTGCAYEQEHHRRLARRAKISPGEVDRVAVGPGSPGWSQRERLLLEATDELHHHHDLTDDTWAALRAHLDDRGLIELVLLVAHYEMLATVIGTLRIPLDRGRRR